ncbi:MAG: UvrD-helicase domain-containing protein [Melioribacteraceae bacterium]|nr:UvrD-helicase domain-containing protein [Melioribacteraceae bacterium]
MNQLTSYQKSALEYNKHISLTANAGSGKTFVLAKRYVQIALEENISLQSIIAITFTEKAAAELYSRISREIDERLTGETVVEVKEKLYRIRRQLVSAKISTIHSFCSEVLKEYSPEIGLDANFTSIDQNLSDEIIEKEISDYIGRKISVDETLRQIIRLLGSNAKATSFFTDAIKNIKTVRTLGHSLYKKNISAIVGFWENESDKLFNKIIIGKLESVLNLVEEINNSVLGQDNTNEIASEIAGVVAGIRANDDIIKILDLLFSLKSMLFTSGGNLRKQKYLGKNIESFNDAAEEINRFYSDMDFFKSVEKDRDILAELASFGNHVINSVIEIYKGYSGVKQRMGYMDFDDLLHYAEKLTGLPYVIESLSVKYRYIMIDEYQDTDETQFNIFIPILKNLSAGNLFVVGDEKQSIYMFRGAELKVFEKTKEMIANSPDSGLLLELPHSFRLSPEIAFFCNRLFRNLFASAETEFNEVSHSELISIKDNYGGGELQLLLSNDAEEVYESVLVANKIKELVSLKNICYKDIAVLVRKRDSFKSLEEEFNKHKIPFNIIGGKGFYQQQVVSDIYSYLSFLIDTSDDISLLTVLRSPFFFVPDSTIYLISLESGETFYDKLTGYADKDGELSTVLNQLHKHLLYVNKLELPDLISQILIDTNYFSVVSGRFDSNQQLANIDKLIHQSLNYNKHSFKSLYDFIDYLKNSILKKTDEGQAAIPTDSNAVNLMTIHQSKGLEFKAAFIFHSHLSTQTDQIKAGEIKIDKEYGVLTKLPEANNYFKEFLSPRINSVFNYKSYRKNLAETKRLLYVAVTRASDYLYITGELKNGYPENSFLGLLFRGLNSSPDSEKIELTGTHIILKDERQYEKPISVTIPVIRETIYQDTKPDNTIPKSSTGQIKINIKNIPDKTKNEIVSATKINIFSQCPLKYHLTYNLGYIKLFQEFVRSSESNYYSREDDEYQTASDIKGRIIHKLLEMETGPEDLKSSVENLIKVDYNLDNISNNILVESVTDKLSVYFKSDIYKEIKSFDKYENELELYLKRNDYYLYGIIDKLIFAKDKLIVVDYKTDHVDNRNIKSKFEYYKNQILFYSYLARNFYNWSKPVELRLVFISNPDKSIRQIVSGDELTDFSNRVDEIVLKIRENRYEKNLNHCKACHYYVNNNCVVK